MHALEESARDGCVLARIPESARALAAASLSANTRRAYARALERLETYLAGRERDDATRAAYLAARAAAGGGDDRLRAGGPRRRAG